MSLMSTGEVHRQNICTQELVSGVEDGEPGEYPEATCILTQNFKKIQIQFNSIIILLKIDYVIKLAFIFPLWVCM